MMAPVDGSGCWPAWMQRWRSARDRWSVTVARLRYHQSFVPVTHATDHAVQPDPDQPPRPRGSWALDVITRSWAGRAILIGRRRQARRDAVVRVVGRPTASLIERRSARSVTLALLIGIAYFAAGSIGLARRRLLWRVRRKLILSLHLRRPRAGAAIVVFFVLAACCCFAPSARTSFETRLRAPPNRRSSSRGPPRSSLAHAGAAETRRILERKQACSPSAFPKRSWRSCPSAAACDRRHRAPRPRCRRRAPIRPGRGCISIRPSALPAGCGARFSGLVATR